MTDNSQLPPPPPFNAPRNIPNGVQPALSPLAPPPPIPPIAPAPVMPTQVPAPEPTPEVAPAPEPTPEPQVEKQPPKVEATELKTELTTPDIPFGTENVQAENDSLMNAVEDDDELLQQQELAKLRESATALANVVPCGTREEMIELLKKVISESKEEDVSKDKDVLRIQRSLESLTASTDALRKSIELTVGKVESPNADLAEEIDGITSTGTANIFAMHKPGQAININGRVGWLSIMGLTGNIRRITLWNSGLQLQLRAPTIDQLLVYQRDITEMTAQYGLAMGAPYYLFADAHITEYTVNQFLRKLVIGSNYVDSTNWDALKARISYQDYPIIMTALIGMTYPTGITTSFTCGNPECRHTETMNLDLSKLVLVNRHAFTPVAKAHLHLTSKLDDDKLAKYAAEFNFNKDIEVKYDVGGIKRRWKVSLKQCTLEEYVTTASAYLDELETTKLESETDLKLYLATSELRMFKPWIKEITGYFSQGTDEREVVLSNTGGDVYNSMALNDILTEWQTYCPEVRERISDYILSTRVSHVAFYYPNCVKCGATTTSAFGGYIPYDAQSGFFTHSQLRLMQALSSNRKTI